MCGIAGMYSHAHSREDGHELTSRMLDTIAHRGPDHKGLWSSFPVTLGHQRLKIIDLSDRANQPFEYEGLVVTFNGEIYNFRALRHYLEQKGYQFQTESDTEVLAASYRQWGDQCVDHLVGMWAFAIWDRGNHRLFCSRDRFGIKPFYYIHDQNSFYFASEYKALKTLPAFRNALNLAQVKRGLIAGWAGYNEDTFYKQVKSLPASHNLIVEGGSIRMYRYWDLKDDDGSPELSEDEKAGHFHDLFRESVRIHSHSDVPVGGCLSGGLDSSSIASMYCTLFPWASYKTFTIYYEGKSNVDERPFANEVVNKYPQIKPFTFKPTDDDVRNHFHHAMHFAEVPLLGSSYMSQYFLMKLASEHGVKVVLDGQGSDEYLGGYLHVFNRLIGKLFNNLHVLQAVQLLNTHRLYHDLTYKQTLGVLSKGLFMSVQKEESAFNYELRRHKFIHSEGDQDTIVLERKSKDKVNNFLYHSLFTTSLPTLLHHEDRNSMAFSLESRVPFLDHRLVQFVFSLPVEDKVSHRAETKYILRKAMKDILPTKVAERRDKKGFVTPGESQWLRGPLKHLVEDMDYANLDWMDTQAVKSLFERYKRGDNSNTKLVWRLTTLNYWLKHFN